VSPGNRAQGVSLSSGSSLFVVRGSGNLLSKEGQNLPFTAGQAFFVPCNLNFEVISEEGALLYRTTVG